MSSEQEKQAIIKSQAGMRFIAQTTIYNSGDFERMGRFISENYTQGALVTDPPERRLLDIKTAYKLNGRIRVKQLLAVSEYQVALVAETEKNSDFFYAEVQVEEDYPHLIQRYLFTRLKEAGTDPDR